MKRFIAQCACRGQRPRGIAPDKIASRPRLLTRMLENRRVLRCLVAPAGFGKSTVACEYAEMMFGFDHVFWIDASSPCFLRDLDARTLASSMRESDDRYALAVFSDVPWLADERAQAFSALIDELLEAGCEVVATMRPHDDCLGALQRDRIVLDAAALLVTAAEASSDTLAPPMSQAGLGDMGQCIPCLRWSAYGERELLEGCAGERLPRDMRLALWAMLAMGEGRCDDLESLLGQARAREVWSDLQRHYPYAGIARDGLTFRALAVEPDALREAFGDGLDTLAEEAGEENGESLALRVGSWLMQRGEVTRAAGLVTCFASRPAAASWLARCGWGLLWRRKAPVFLKAHEQIDGAPTEVSTTLTAMAAWAHLQMRSTAQAVTAARRVLVDERAADSLKAVAALCAWDAGNADTRRAMRSELLALKREHADGDSAFQAAEERLVALLGDIVLSEASGAQAVDEWLAACADLLGNTAEKALSSTGDVEQALLLAASWVIDCVAAQGTFGAGFGEQAALPMDGVAAMAQRCHGLLIADLAMRGSLGFGSMRAAEALDMAAACDDSGRIPSLPEEVQQAWGAARAAEAPQRAVPLAKGESDRRRPRRDGSAVPVGLATSSVPLLHVRLFGGLRATIGGREVSEELLSKRKARLLLTLLVLNRGRDYSREELASALWPKAQPRTALKSFYRQWQELAALLAVDGSCPYLQRDRHRCRLDPTLFVSDVMEFEALTGSLLLDLARGANDWEEALRHVREDFGGELLPGEERCDTVVAYREQFSLQLIDGLIAASTGLRNAGNTQAALWFAREAMRRDKSREDVYEALMRAQMAAGQRSAALDTFFSCRRYLAEALGLDPSSELQRLYQKLVEGEEAMA